MPFMKILIKETILYIVYDPFNYKNMQRNKTQLQVIETSEEIGRRRHPNSHVWDHLFLKIK